MILYNLCQRFTHSFVGERGGDVLRSCSIFIANLEIGWTDGGGKKREKRLILISDAVIVISAKEDLDAL